MPMTRLEVYKVSAQPRPDNEESDLQRMADMSPVFQPNLAHYELFSIAASMYMQ